MSFECLSEQRAESGGRGFQARVDAGDMVEAAPLREAFEALEREEGLTAYQLADRVRWVRPDGQRVRRTLGLRLERNKGHIGKYLSYENALALCRAMNLDPVDIGL